MPSREETHPGSASAYGGAGWQPRPGSLRDEIGGEWAPCGLSSEWAPLRQVLLHRPGPELAQVGDPDESLMLDRPDPDAMADEHDGMAEAYRAAGVTVHYVEPAGTPPPNQMFCADLMFMTPEGAVVGRPASIVRAGEERWIARRLADLGVPILRSIGGRGTFEGADALWLTPECVMVGIGIRTNPEGSDQLAHTLAEQGVEVIEVDLPHASMHLMGEIRIVDRDLVFVRRGRCPWRAVHALRDTGYEVRFFPSETEARRGMAHNFVVLGPRKILMPSGNPESRTAFQEAGIETVEVPMGVLARAAGSVGCLTGIVERDEG